MNMNNGINMNSTHILSIRRYLQDIKYIMINSKGISLAMRLREQLIGYLNALYDLNIINFNTRKLIRERALHLIMKYSFI